MRFWGMGAPSARLSGAPARHCGGLFSLYRGPWGRPGAARAGGHRITAMRAQGVRWALGQCELYRLRHGSANGVNDETS